MTDRAIIILALVSYFIVLPAIVLLLPARWMPQGGETDSDEILP